MLSRLFSEFPWLAPILVFGIVVFVHELGHFMAAKAFGVYAPRFSIGFGPALFKKRWGETEYVLAALPLGGYVRMASREDEAVAFLEGGGERPREETRMPNGQHHEPHTVGASGAEKILPAEPGDGLRPKDWDPEALVPFGPKPVPEHRWFESKSLLARLAILIAGVSMNAVLTLVATTSGFAIYGRPLPVPAVIDSIVPNMPAQRAGLTAGDSITAIDGRPVTGWAQVVERIASSAGDTLTIQVARGAGGERREIRVSPELTEVRDPETGDAQRIGRIGAAAVRDRRQPLTVGQSFEHGWNTTLNMGGAVLRVLGQLVTGRVSVSQLGGPIQIARVSVEAARTGVENLLFLIGFLSINVAIFNLLPIPILDGGQILLNVAESVKGRPFSSRTREVILRVGLVAIGLLFVTVMWNDIVRWITNRLG